MPEDQVEVRRINWSECFPFVRLLGTTRRALSYHHLAMGLCAVVLVYVAGRVLDVVWRWGGAGVVTTSAAPLNELQAFATRDAAGFHAWMDQTQRDQRQAARDALQRFGGIEDGAEIEKKARSGAAASVLNSREHAQAVRDALEFIRKQVRAGRTAIAADTSISAADRTERIARLERAADSLRFTLAGVEPPRVAANEAQTALAQIIAADASADPAARGEQTNRLQQTIAKQQALNVLRKQQPAGVFASLLNYEMRCFSAAVQGVAAGRWGFAGSALDKEPSLLGSVASAGSGVVWLVTQRPWYALFFGLVLLATFAFFGSVICRNAALSSARGEGLSLGGPVQFACEHYLSSVAAVLMPLGLLAAVAAALFVGGLVGAIPWLGELATGLLFILALLGGVAMVFALVGLVLGLHLLWPTIAVEGSDAFDAVQHGFGYVFQRGWHVAFYSFVLLVYGGASFIMARLVLMVLLKCSHAATDAGMSWFGVWSGGATDTVTKLDALWHMPAWGELSLLPSTGDTPFWGDFNHAPLTGTEWLAAFFVKLWVFLIVALLGAFVVSFYFVGSTAMYFLLRRDIDAVDYEEVYYEESEDAFDEPAPATPAPAPQSGGTPLPVVANPAAGAPGA